MYRFCNVIFTFDVAPLTVSNELLAVLFRQESMNDSMRRLSALELATVEMTVRLQSE